jgi:hypothetical protein
MSETLKTSREVWLARALLVALCVLAFGRCVTSPLVLSWDDNRYLDVASNPTLVPSWDAFVRMWTETHMDAYHPLHLLSYWLDVPWFGATGPVTHTTNLILWVVVVLGLHRAFTKLGLSLFAATFGVALYAAHPASVEAVGWASDRKDLVALVFGMLALNAHLDAKSMRDPAAWRASLFVLFAALSKATAVALPAAFIALDLWTSRRTLREAFSMQAPALTASALLGAVAASIWIDHDMIYGVGADAPTRSWQLIPATLTHYLRTTFFPDALTPLYALERHVPSTMLEVIAGPASVAAALFAAWQVRKESASHALVGAGLLLFVVFFLPVSNVLAIYFQWGDRFLVWMNLGLALSAAALVDAFAPKDLSWRGAVMAACLVVPLVARSVQYSEAWSSDLRLWSHAVSVEPEAYFAWLQLAEVRRDGRDWDGAMRAASHATTIAPEEPLPHGVFLSSLALRDEARQHLAPSRALAHASVFLRAMNDAEQLRELAATMQDEGYRDAMLFVLGRSLDVAPVRNDQLEHATAVQLRDGNVWLARFYLSRMTERPLSPLVTRFFEGELRRNGLPLPAELAAPEGAQTP